MAVLRWTLQLQALYHAATFSRVDDFAQQMSVLQQRTFWWVVDRVMMRLLDQPIPSGQGGDFVVGMESAPIRFVCTGLAHHHR
jgi:hypothetical protein